MSTLRTISILAGILLTLGTLATAAEKPSEFFLRDGDVYVIYGDSITDGATYPRTIENYVLTRFPKWNVTFYNLGWGGDVAGNLFRVTRDVLPIKPTAFSDCMGMNDGGYSAVSEPRLNSYINAYREMIPMLRKANPEVRIALISAIPYENRNGTGAANGAYAQTLRCFAQAKQQLAKEFNTRFVDLFSGYSEKMGMGKVIFPDFVLSGDGVHPNGIGQTIMTLAILKGMGAPAEIADLKIDLSKSGIFSLFSKAAEAHRCKVKDIAFKQGKLTFKRLAEALPCPVIAGEEQTARFLDTVNFADEINRDMLTVVGLTAPAYELRINNVPIEIYSSQELANGVNIAKPMKGPLWDQAMAVAGATNERQNAHYTKWRGVWLAGGGSTSGQYNTSNKTQIDQLDAAAKAAIKKQHELNQPKWMTFTLTAVKEKPVNLPKPVTYSDCSPDVTPRLQPLDWTKAKVKSIDLKTLVNRGFADEVASDQKGGWSDQGPGNDLSPFPTGHQVLAGVPFDIIDPAKNNGKSMVVLSRRAGQGTPTSVTIPVGLKAKMLAFLHIGAWVSNTKMVEVILHYSNGLSMKAGFNAGIHFTDWWSTPEVSPSLVRAWVGNNKSAGVAATYTPLPNPTPEQTITSIELVVPENTDWVYGLIAITALE
jgi:lysophospholipase L1-like esterase